MKRQPRDGKDQNHDTNSPYGSSGMVPAGLSEGSLGHTAIMAA